MNYVCPLSTVICHGCAGEFVSEQLHEDGLCLGCRVTIRLAVEAEQSLDRLYDAFDDVTNIEIAAVVKRAQVRAHAMHDATYSLSRVITESMHEARRLIGAKKFHAESLISDREPVTSSERDSRFEASL